VGLSKAVPVHLEPDNSFFPCDSTRLTVLFKDYGDSAASTSIHGRQFQRVEIPVGKEDSSETLSSKLADELTKLTVFRNPWVVGTPRQFQVDLHVDKNGVSKAEINRLRKLVAEVKRELGESSNAFEFVLAPRTNQSSSAVSEVTAIDSDRLKRQQKLFFDNQDPLLTQQLLESDPTVLFHFGSEYKFSGSSLDKESLIAFCRALESGKAEPHFKSQKPSLTDHFSRKIVASEFDQRVLGSPLSQLIFYYSHHCGSCKRFLPMFEEMALDNLRQPLHKLTFNRIDNEHNQIPSQDVLLSTPKIVLFRSDSKSSPIEYRSDKLNRALLQGFINASLGFSLLSDWSLVEKAAAAQAETIRSGFLKDLTTLN
jgi:thiol-disulfide isomerase/thioredoxin